MAEKLDEYEHSSLADKGNKAQAAKLLNIGIATLYRKIEEYRIGAVN